MNLLSRIHSRYSEARRRRQLDAMRRAFAKRGEAGADMVAFQCNICGGRCAAPREVASGRETISCYHCGSTLRFRAVVHALVAELLGVDQAMPEVTPRKTLAGVGLSDAPLYAAWLGDRFDYRNTFYHQPPRLDISRLDPREKGCADFVVCSEVFEHIDAPVQPAFDNLFALLKPGGLCVFSVPYDEKADATTEHFPGLHDYQIVRRGRRRILVNRTPAGKTERYEKLHFHGGDGATLEMRIFSLTAVLDHLRRAGFIDIKIRRETCPAHGICWPDGAACPLTVRKPAAGCPPSG